MHIKVEMDNGKPAHLGLTLWEQPLDCVSPLWLLPGPSDDTPHPMALCQALCSPLICAGRQVNRELR